MNNGRGEQLKGSDIKGVTLTYAQLMSIRTAE